MADDKIIPMGGEAEEPIIVESPKKKPFRITRGNKKIGKDTLILNMTSATDCPSRKRGLCQLKNTKQCYALQPERMYPQCLPFRRAQEEQWDRMSAEEIAEVIAGIVKRARKPIKYLRFSEAGDFRTQADVNKMSRLADLLRPAGLRVYGYTARSDLSYGKVSRNMVLTGSGFIVHNQFRAVEELSGAHPVCPGNCRSCNRCKVRGGKIIEVLIHGSNIKKKKNPVSGWSRPAQRIQLGAETALENPGGTGGIGSHSTHGGRELLERKHHPTDEGANFVLMKIDGPTPYVVWTEDKKTKATFWGHYFTEYDDAKTFFDRKVKRVKKRNPKGAKKKKMSDENKLAVTVAVVGLVGILLWKRKQLQ